MAFVFTSAHERLAAHVGTELRQHQHIVAPNFLRTSFLHFHQVTFLCGGAASIQTQKEEECCKFNNYNHTKITLSTNQ